MSLFGLEDKIQSNPGDLSGGQRSRLGVIRALLHNPEVVFADEPTADLDKAIEYEIMSALSRWKHMQPYRTLIFATHNLELAMEWADYFIVFPDAESEKGSTSPIHLDAKNKAKKASIHDKILTLLNYPEVGASKFRDKNSKQDPTNESLDSLSEDSKYRTVFKEMEGKRFKRTLINNICCFFRLCFFDFIRHPRKKGSMCIMWGPPILIFSTILFLICSVFFISGANKGTTAQYNRELDNPFLWCTYVNGENVWKIPEDQDLYQGKPFGFERLYCSFRNSYKKSEVDLSGRTMNSEEELAKKVRESLLWPKTEAEKQSVLNKNNFFGIVITEHALRQKLGYQDIYPPPDVEFVFHMSTNVYVPLPVLGIADKLPYGDFVFSEGLVQSVRSGRFLERIKTDHLHIEFTPRLNEAKCARFEEILKDNLTELAKSDEIGKDIELAQICPETYKSKNQIYMKLDKPTYYFYLTRLIEKSISELDPSLKYNLDLGSACCKMDYDQKTNYTHWVFLMKKKHRIVKRFIEESLKANLFVDTSILSKVESLEKTMNIFNAIFKSLNIGSVLLSLGIIAIIFWFDSYRRIHNIGVLFGLGLSIWYYLAMALCQMMIVYSIGMFITILGNYLFFNDFCNIINAWINPQESLISYEVLTINEQWKLAYPIIGLVSFPVLILKFIIFNKTPSELIRYQD
jgi:energy-coupling factor transporter ATP-binding protein EcfA2